MISRRMILSAAVLVAAASTETTRAESLMSRITAYAFSFPALAGSDISLANYAGRPLLIVNTASLCGYTPQYAGLQQLWTEFHDRGLMIIGVPSNDSAAKNRAARTRSSRPRATNTALPFPLRPKPW